MKINHLISQCISLIFISAFAVLLCKLVFIYFKFETTVSINVITNGGDCLPAITLRFDVLNNVNDVLVLSNTSDADVTLFSGLLSYPETRNLTLTQTPIKQCFIVSLYSNYSIDCSRIANVTSRLTRHAVYLTLFDTNECRRQLIISGNKLSVNEIAVAFIFQASFLGEVSYHYCVNVHWNRYYLSNDDYCRESTTAVYADYSIIASYKQLPLPYNTDCLDYASIGYQSQRDCFDTCIVSNVRNKCSTTATISEVTEKECIRKFGLVSTCHSLCIKRDCSAIIAKINDDQTSVASFKLKGLYLRQKSTNELRYIFVPKSTFIDVLMKMALMFAFWFGISVFKLVSLVYTVFGYLCPRNEPLNSSIEIEFEVDLTIECVQNPKWHLFLDTRCILLTLLMLFCAAIAIIEPLRVTKEYIHYNTTVDVAINSVAADTMPAVTLVYQTLPLIDTTKYCSNQSKHCDKEPKFLDEKHLFGISLRRIDTSLLNITQIVTCCYKHNLNANCENCMSLAQVTKSYRKTNTFITYYFRKKTAASFNTESLIELMFNTTYRPLIAVHSLQSFANVHRDNSQRILPNVTTQLTFNKKQFQLLKAPFATDCLLLQSKKNTTKRDCYIQCFASRHLKRCGFNNAHQLNVYINDKPFVRNSSCLHINHISKICHRKCSKNPCQVEEYALHTANIVNQGSGRTKVILRTLTPYFQISFTFRPTYEFIDVLNCYLKSFLIWTGFSVLTIISLLLSVCTSNYEFLNAIRRTANVSKVVKEFILFKVTRKIEALQNRTGRNRNLQLTVVLVCISMAFLHSTTFISVYFQYPITIKAIIYVPKANELPMFTVSTDSSNVWETNVVNAQLKPENMKKQHFLNDCKVFEQNSTQNCDLIAVRMDDTTISYTFFERNVYKDKSDYSIDETSLVLIVVTVANTGNAFIVTNSPFNRNSVIKNNGGLYLWSNTKNVLTYRKTIISNLTKSSICNDKREEVKQFEDCLKNCLSMSDIEESQYSTEKNVTFKLINQRTTQKRYKCNRYCFEKRCYFEFYDTILVSSQKLVQNDQISIEIQHPSELFYEYELRSKYTFGDLLEYFFLIAAYYIAFRIYYISIAFEVCLQASNDSMSANVREIIRNAINARLKDEVDLNRTYDLNANRSVKSGAIITRTLVQNDRPTPTPVPNIVVQHERPPPTPVPNIVVQAPNSNTENSASVAVQPATSEERKE